MREPDTTPPDGTVPDLARHFPAQTLEAWRAEVETLLKGAPYDRRMLTVLPEGITLRPLYTALDTEMLEVARVVPGEAPFTRGARVLGYRLDPWEIAQELPFPDATSFNEALRHDLERGQTTAVLALDAAGRAGLDPHEAPAGRTGRGGTSLATLAEFEAALSGVDLDRVPLFLHAGSAALPAASLLLAWMRRRGIDPTRLRGCVGSDPLADALAGSTEASEAAIEAAYDRLAALSAWIESQTSPSDPRLRTLVAWGTRWHDAGGSAVEELAYTLASAVQTLRALERRGLDPEAAARRLFVGFAAGPRFLVEIAKFRAARMLWGRIGEACGWEDGGGDLWIHARTATRNQSAIDPHTNLLRATTEALAAILGGCDSLTVVPFDAPAGLPSDSARRLARNTQLILRDESRFDAVLDAAGGSWALESITAELAEKAWELFREVESDGGLLAALLKGTPQSRVASAAEELRRNVATRRDVLVGVNQYANPEDPPLEARAADHASLHAAAEDRMRRHRETAARPETPQRLDAVRAAAVGLAARRGDGGDAAAAASLCRASIDAAFEGATLGELARALGLPGPTEPDADGTTPASPRIAPLPVVRLAAEFAALRAAVRALQAERRGRGADEAEIQVLCFGPIAALRPRLEFTRGFFRTGGFALSGDVAFDADQAGIEAAARATLASGAAVAVLVSADDLHATLIPSAASALKSAADPPAVVLAGFPPDASLVATLREAGVDEFIHLKADACAVLTALARRIGGRA